MSNLCKKHGIIHDEPCPKCVKDERDELQAEVERLRAEIEAARAEEKARCLNILSTVVAVHGIQAGSLAFSALQDAARTINGPRVVW